MMNRKHNIKDYLNIFEKLKKINSKIAFSSDFIISYPGELEEDFKNTLSLIEKIKFINSYSFIFSPRPGTIAADLGLIDRKISIERLEKVQNKLYENQMNRNKLFKNQIIDVLVENLTEDKTQTFGKSEYMTSVIFNGSKEHIGKVVSVKIKEFNRSTLFGELIEDTNKQVA
jgi:tRNA-2-methylthio-N6-dimethylallyladenosine synthase